MVASCSGRINKWAVQGQSLILVNNKEQMITTQRNKMQSVRNFIAQSNNANFLKKKKYDYIEVLSLFLICDGKDNYQLHLFRSANSPQYNFFNLIFDRKLLLLIITMLISTLLRWLAWSLANSTYKLKNAANYIGMRQSKVALETRH